MRFVALGDIPGNAPALRSALAEARRRGFDRLVIWGDLMTYGPETDELLDLYKQQLGEYQQNKESADKLLSSGSFKPKSELDRAELAAWTMVANTILNLDETITKN